METKEELKKLEMRYAIHYFTHTYYVVLAWKTIRNALLNAGVISESEFDFINHLIAWHDNSKISESEFVPYAVGLYSRDKDDIQIHSQFKEAVKHHKDANLHHYESLNNYSGSDWKCYVIELVCDYIAMGWEFNNFLFEYYEKEKEKILLKADYKSYLEGVLAIIKNTCYKEVESPMSLDLERYILNI